MKKPIKVWLTVGFKVTIKYILKISPKLYSEKFVLLSSIKIVCIKWHLSTPYILLVTGGNLEQFEKNTRCTNKFPPFFYQKWAFIVKERNLMFYSKYCQSHCSSYVWHESWYNNASNSASSYTFGLPKRSLSSMSNSPFLNIWNHSRQLLSLKTASPYVSTSNRCASAADFFKLKK